MTRTERRNGFKPWLVLCLAFAVPKPGHVSEQEDSAAPGKFYASATVSVVPGSDFEQLGAPATVQDVGRQLAFGFRGLSIGAAEMDVGVDYQYSRYEFDGIQGRDRDLHRFEVRLRVCGGGNIRRSIASIGPRIAVPSNAD